MPCLKVGLVSTTWIGLYIIGLYQCDTLNVYIESILLSSVSVGMYETLFALPTPVRCQCGDV